MYQLIAWLPGEPQFLAKNEEGALGFLSPRGFVVNPSVQNAEAVVMKYAYELLPTPLSSDGAPGDLVRISGTLPLPAWLVEPEG